MIFSPRQTVVWTRISDSDAVTVQYKSCHLSEIRTGQSDEDLFLLHTGQLVGIDERYCG